MLVYYYILCPLYDNHCSHLREPSILYHSILFNIMILVRYVLESLITNNLLHFHFFNLKLDLCPRQALQECSVEGGG